MIITQVFPKRFCPLKNLREFGGYSMTDILRINQVCQLLGVGRSTFYRMISSGAFPGGFRVGARSRRWTISAVDQWIAQSEKESGKSTRKARS